MPDKNTALKAKFLETGYTARKVSRKTNIPESYISYHLHGRWVFSKSEKEAIAEVLNCSSSEIFPEAGA